MSIDSNIQGKEFGRLTAIRFVRRDKHHIKYWLFKCRCGAERINPASMVIRGKMISCGCYAKEKFKKDYTVHGQVRTPLYAVWQHMKQRCYKPNCKEYKNYGAIGVTVCDEWLIPKNFFDWCLANGWEKRKQIDKDIIPKKLGIPPIIYSPETCCFVTSRENTNCRKVTKYVNIEGCDIAVTDVERKYGINRSTLYNRLKRGLVGLELLSTEKLRIKK